MKEQKLDLLLIILRVYSFADFDGKEDYKASISTDEGILTPTIFANNVQLKYDSDNSTSLRGEEILTLPVNSNVLFLENLLATETENVNPFLVSNYNGSLSLSPASDVWVNIKRTTKISDNGKTRERKISDITTFRSLNSWGNWLGMLQTEE